ncbi:MAG: nucleotide exchange factor GrpE [Pirellulaceae bacterium]
MQPEESEINEEKRADRGSSSQAESRASDVDTVLDEALQAEEPTVSEPPKTDSQRVQDAEKEVLLAKAEMENFKKRLQRESEQMLKYANLPLVRDLLEVWDNLRRATDAAEGDDAAVKALRDGVSMVSQQMTDTLAKYGCRRVDALGEEFDPNVHEAISQMPSEEYESGKVMNEVGVGYVLHDRVVRPSHVIVSTGKPDA